MFGVGWLEIVIFVFFLLCVTVMVRAGFQVAWANRKPGLPPPSRGEKLAAGILFAVIFILLDVLAVQELRVLTHHIGGWDEQIAVGGIIGGGVIVIMLVWGVLVRPLGATFYEALRLPRKN